MIPMLVHPVIFTNEVIAVDSEWNVVASAASPNMPTVNPINVENTNAVKPTVSYNRRNAANSSPILVELGRDISIPVTADTLEQPHKCSVCSGICT